MERKRINILVPLDLYKRFIEIFPYRGELTAFILHCMQRAVLYKRKLTAEEVCSAGQDAKKRI